MSTTDAYIPTSKMSAFLKAIRNIGSDVWCSVGGPEKWFVWEMSPDPYSDMDNPEAHPMYVYIANEDGDELALDRVFKRSELALYDNNGTARSPAPFAFYFDHREQQVIMSAAVCKALFKPSPEYVRVNVRFGKPRLTFADLESTHRAVQPYGVVHPNP